MDQYISIPSFFLLKNTKQPLKINIIDKSLKPGQCLGASSIAAGIIHPYKVKLNGLVHRGDGGMKTVNVMIEAAERAMSKKMNNSTAATILDLPFANQSIEITDDIYRLAISGDDLSRLQKVVIDNNNTMNNSNTSIKKTKNFSSSEFLPQTTIEDLLQSKTEALGGVKLNGCRVLHVPSYLYYLYEACRDLAFENGGSVTWEGGVTFNFGSDIGNRTGDETLIFAGGAEQFKSSSTGKIEKSILDFILQHSGENDRQFPVSLVTSQLLEIRDLQKVNNLDSEKRAAFLFGKYIVPSPNNGCIIGSTHEFKGKLSALEVAKSLRNYTESFSPKDINWDSIIKQVEDSECCNDADLVGNNIAIRSGVKVQSNRGQLGRIPIAGPLFADESKHYIFTSLGSRGLLLHGVYGDLLSRRILFGVGEEGGISTTDANELDWWKHNTQNDKKKKRRKEEREK